MMDDLKALVGQDEQIMYEGKPNKKCFIFECIFNPLLPFALLWAIIDFSIIGGVLLQEDIGEIGTIVIPFFLIHLMPVWIYLGGIIFSFRKYRNTAYIVTDRAIYVSEGIFRKNFIRKSFGELSHINLHRGIFDQLFKVGDVVATSNQIDSKGKNVSIKISSIENYIEVYNLVKKLQTDVYTDVMYPNALRPGENPGYQTKYKGE